MSDNSIPLHAVPILEALGRRHGSISFAELKEQTEVAPATLNRLLHVLCEYRYAMKVGHGKYVAGPSLVSLGMAVTTNQILPGFQPMLCRMVEQSQLNAELYVVTPGGPVFLSLFAAKGEANVSFRSGHVIMNRTSHPAGRFFLALHQGQSTPGFDENFIVDRGEQWPELFRAAAMIPNTAYCVALSGMLTNVDSDRHRELKTILHETPTAFDIPGYPSSQR